MIALEIARDSDCSGCEIRLILLAVGLTSRGDIQAIRIKKKVDTFPVLTRWCCTIVCTMKIVVNLTKSDFVLLF